MSRRVVLSSAMLVIAMQTAGCGKQQAAAADAGTNGAPPGIRYEAHVNAGGVPPAAMPPPGPPAARTSDAKAGEGLFASMNCDGCHGGGATGWEGPSLVDGRWRYGGGEEEIFQSIFYGRPKGMPAYGGVLGADGAWMIVKYLKSQPVPAVVPTINYENINTPSVPTPDRETSAPAAPSAPA